MVDKIEIHNTCLERLQSQIDELKSAIDKVHESVINEQNSTAGNKFETARAMGQEELDRLNRQLNNANVQMNMLSQIDPTIKCTSAQMGAIIKTTRKTLYLSIGLGKILLDKKPVFAISSISPIGKNIMGKEVGDKATFAGKNETITEIY